MHEHFAVIDREIVWYGSVNLLSNAKEEDNLMRVKSREIGQELLEISFLNDYSASFIKNKLLQGNILWKWSMLEWLTYSYFCDNITYIR